MLGCENTSVSLKDLVPESHTIFKSPDAPSYAAIMCSPGDLKAQRGDQESERAKMQDREETEPLKMTDFSRISEQSVDSIDTERLMDILSTYHLKYPIATDESLDEEGHVVVNSESDQQTHGSFPLTSDLVAKHEAGIRWEDEQSISPRHYQVANWRIRGRFLEYLVVPAGTSRFVESYWVRGVNMAQEGMVIPIAQYFHSHPAELQRLNHLTSFIDRHDMVITDNSSLQIHGSSGSSCVGLTFYISDCSMRPGSRYRKVPAEELDLTVWRSSIGRYWQERKLAYDLWQDNEAHKHTSTAYWPEVDVSNNVIP